MSSVGPMMFLARLAPLLAAGLLGSLLVTSASCGDDTDGTGGANACEAELDAQGCFDTACWTEQEGRSFRNDVLPILERSCALSSACHGDPSSPSSSAGYRPYLGSVDEQAEPSDVAAILAVLVGQTSPSSSLALVEPGQPERSYLMHKVDGSLGCSAADCGDRCGKAMPDPGSLLPLEERNAMRDWIVQGALDN
jgi:hypothetical protein